MTVLSFNHMRLKGMTSISNSAWDRWAVGAVIVVHSIGWKNVFPTVPRQIHDLVSVAIMGRLFSHCSADHHTTWNFCWGHAKMSLVTLFSSQLSRRRHGGTFTSTSRCTMQPLHLFPWVIRGMSGYTMEVHLCSR